MIAALLVSDNDFRIDGDCVFVARIGPSWRSAVRRREKMRDKGEIAHLRRLKA